MVLALMICQTHGVPQSACIMVATAFLTAIYSIKTGFGISEGNYYIFINGSTTNSRARTTGSRLASALWMIVSCICFSVMLKLCHGVSFCDPRNTLTHPRTSDGFVDDVTHWCNLGLLHSLLHDVSVQDIASGLEREGQTWERLL